MNIASIAVLSTLLFALSAGPAWAQKEAAGAAEGQEVTGLFPGLESSTGCDENCSESYEAKCTQSSKTLWIVVGDDWDGAHWGVRFADSFVRAQVMGLAPTGVNWRSQASDWINPGGNWGFAITRPSGEGAIRALALVQAHDPGTPGDRIYAIDIYCWSNVYANYRNASLLKKFDN